MRMFFSLLFAVILTYFFSNNIKKHAKIYYCISILIVLATITVDLLHYFNGFKLTGILRELERISVRGILATAFFILVMYAGALNPKWSYTRQLMKIRAELAIIASILMIAHAFMYTLGFATYIGPMLKSGAFPIFYFTICIIGLLAFILMVPLFITSFKCVRAKMSSKRWQKLQRWSYLFYFLTFTHVMVIFLRDEKLEYISLAVYGLVFGIYTILRVRTYFSKKHDKNITF